MRQKRNSKHLCGWGSLRHSLHLSEQGMLILLETVVLLDTWVLTRLWFWECLIFILIKHRHTPFPSRAKRFTQAHSNHTGSMWTFITQ